MNDNKNSAQVAHVSWMDYISFKLNGSCCSCPKFYISLSQVMPSCGIVSKTCTSNLNSIRISNLIENGLTLLQLIYLLLWLVRFNRRWSEGDEIPNPYRFLGHLL